MFDSSHVSKGVEGGTAKPETPTDGTSREVWSYLLGLYFADGSLSRYWRTCWRVSFYLSGDEAGLVERVSSLLSGLGWKPRVAPPRKRHYFTVKVGGSGSPSPRQEATPVRRRRADLAFKREAG